MSNIVQGPQLRLLNFGQKITKTGLALPSTATGTLFTVAGGSILVTNLLGLVTTAVGGTATTLALGTAPTTGTLDTDGIATATAITSSEAGVWVTPVASAGLGGALAVGSLGGSSPFVTTQFAVAPGTITWTTSANAGGGVFSWYLTYLPLDDGASVS